MSANDAVTVAVNKLIEVMDEDETFEVHDLDTAVVFLKDKAVESVGKTGSPCLKFTSKTAQQFMDKAGVDVDTQKQYQAAETLFVRAVYKLTGDKLVETIKADPKVALEDVSVRATFSTGKNNGAVQMYGEKEYTDIKTHTRFKTMGSARLFVSARRHITEDDFAKLTAAVTEASSNR